MEVHGITTERARAEGMPLRDAIEMVAEAVISPAKRRAPGRDEARLRPDHSRRPVSRSVRSGIWSRGVGVGRCSTRSCWTDISIVIARAVARWAPSARTTASTSDMRTMQCADAVASARVLCALAARFKELDEAEPHALHQAQIGWHREWAEATTSGDRARGWPPWTGATSCGRWRPRYFRCRDG